MQLNQHQLSTAWHRIVPQLVSPNRRYPSSNVEANLPIEPVISELVSAKSDTTTQLQSNPLPSIPPLPANDADQLKILPEAEVASQPDAEQIQPQADVDLSIAVEPKVGFRAPDFSLNSLDGQSLQLAQLLGKPMVINYWATWCIPCKKELPILEKLSQEYSQKGVVFVSVNAIDQDNLDNVKSVVNELSMTFPVLLDENRKFADTYRAIFFPTTFIIDASGVIRQVSLGDNTEEELRLSLDQLISDSL